MLETSVEDNRFSTKGFNPSGRTWTARTNEHQSKVRTIHKGVAEISEKINLNVTVTVDSVFVAIDNGEMFDHQLIEINFGQYDGYGSSTTNTLRSAIPETFAGEFVVNAFCKTMGGQLTIESFTGQVSMPKARPVSIEALDDVFFDIGEKAKVSLICTWDNGSESFVSPDNAVSDAGIVGFDGKSLNAIKQGTDSITYEYNGLKCKGFVRVYGDEVDDEDSDDSPSICSTVPLSFKQKSVMTRQAFRGTLTVNNGNETMAMKDVKMNLEVRDMDGNLTTLFISFA